MTTIDDELGGGREWLDARSRSERPTEIHVPIVEGIGPVWLYQEKRGGWYAYLALGADLPFEMVEHTFGTLAECDHGHRTEAEAWTCAADLARQCVEAVMARG